MESKISHAASANPSDRIKNLNLSEASFNSSQRENSGFWDSIIELLREAWR